MGATALELQAYVGMRGIYRTQEEGLVIEVLVRDARKLGMILELLIAPASCGSGQYWVPARRVTLSPPEIG